jgi:hypothetical protein
MKTLRKRHLKTANILIERKKETDHFFLDTMDHTLHNQWTLYFHDPFNENWEQDGYIELFKCGSVSEFRMMQSCLPDIIVQGMFFVMRSHIFPKWNDAANKDGGFLSIKILKDRVPSFFEDVLIKLMNESLLKK